MKKSILLITFLISSFITFSQTIDVGRTAGQLEVSLTGAATYNVPISVPPGIKDVVPQIGLSYSSQSGNGLAGWGWNVSGLSSISRIPATNFHDGEIDGVDFDLKDRYALDGQRLILVSGTYGAPNSTYTTENYSNIKVKAFDTHLHGVQYGPKYFEVYYPNGTIAVYGYLNNSTNKLEWAIRKWLDPQGNVIDYIYAYDDGLIRIDYILYGYSINSSSPEVLNKINFIYRDRIRPEQVYVGGHSFTQNKILDRIEVNVDSYLLRRYQITHSTTSLGYQKVDEITEYNGQNHAFEPITFTYETETQEGISRDPQAHNLSQDISAEDGDRVLSGDFDGDGHMDFLTYNKNNRTEFTVFTDLFEENTSNSSITVPNIEFDFQKIFVTNTLEADNKLKQKQSITLVKENNNNDATTEVTFKTYSMNGSQFPLEYVKTWNAPAYQTSSIDNDNCESSETITGQITKRFVTGDFNGDGLSDVLSISRSYYYYDNCHMEYDPYAEPYVDPWSCECEYHSVENRQVHFINLDRSLTSNFVNLAGDFETNIGNFDILQTGDFNGDGKSDLFHFTEGHAYIYSLDENNQLVLIYHEIDSYIELSKPILLGDYNGDGKTDYIIPEDNGSSFWKFFISNGEVNSKTTIDIGVTFRYNAYGTGSIVDELVWIYNYIPTDVNGDGKTDILYHYYYKSDYIDGYNHLDHTSQKLISYTNMEANDGNFSFIETATNDDNFDGLATYSIPIFLDVNRQNTNLEFAYINDQKIDAFEFHKDHRQDVTLKQIENNGIINNIYFEKLVSENEFYSEETSQIYPFVNINIAASYKFVSSFEQTADGTTQYKVFKYKGAVAHVGGLGFLGFKEIKRTGWYTPTIPKIWSISQQDPLRRGAVTQQWSSLSETDYATNYITRSDNFYTTNITALGVYINIPYRVVLTDALQGITKTTNNTYDSFYNIINNTTSYTGGSKETNYKYSNNESSFDNTYHIGRITKKTNIATLGSETFSTEEEFLYDNNLVTEINKRGNASNWVTENFNYDSFGNITQKTLHADDLVDRSENFEYDTSGRYLIKAIDIEGLESQFSYNTDTGYLLAETNPYGLTTSYQYDDWGRATIETDYLGNQTTISLVSLAGGGVQKTIDYPEGQDEVSTFNAFGWLLKARVLGLNNKWTEITTNYDALGRKESVSEPYFNTNSPTQWTQFFYDEYGRVEEQHLPTGKVIHTTFNGLQVTVDDGVKTVSSTKNTAGHVISVQDPGGTINYTYFANGSMKTADYGGRIVSVNIDGWGRKILLNDPDAGMYTYTYNDIGDILEETTPKGITTYEYDDFGKMLLKKVNGDHTDLRVSYFYNPNTKLLEVIGGIDGVANREIQQEISYDSYQRPDVIREYELTSGGIYTRKKNTYDSYGRPYKNEYHAEHAILGAESTFSTESIFNNAGILTQLIDENSNNLWSLSSVNARGQTLGITLGNNARKSRVYDADGYITKILDQSLIITGRLERRPPIEIEPIETNKILDLDYSFNTQRGLLNSRQNNNFEWNESFTYDDQERLTQITGAVNFTQNYDEKGRINNNSNVGAYTYNANNYQASEIALNETGDQYYQQHSLQQISYNAFKKPVEIYEEGHGRVSFEYNPISMSRATAYYGNEAESTQDRRYVKHYSSIIPVEIIEDRETGTVKIATFVGGDAYTAPIVQIKQNGQNAIDDFYYLHRDYLGSIMAITDTEANIIEQRQFGAWGVVDKFLDSDENTEFTHNSLLNRGYTGHEHFFGVALIHMNGRMYDAQLGRFLSPDNFVQDPYNTQNFNRYGYVWNNPLSFVDPGGENPLLALLYYGLAGAAISVTINGINNLSSGRGFFEGAIQSAITGFIAGMVSNGIGTAINGMANATAQFAIQTLSHAHLGGIMTAMQGGNYWHGFASGAAGSMIGDKVGGMFGADTNKWVQGAAMIGAGGLSGGVGSMIAGGNFWDGARNGMISAGLNHVAHMVVNPEKYIKKYEQNEKTMIENTMKIEILKNFTELGQLEGIAKSVISQWANPTGYNEATSVLSDLQNAVTASGISLTSTAPQIKAVATSLSRGYKITNTWLSIQNRYFLTPIITRYAPAYAARNLPYSSIYGANIGSIGNGGSSGAAGVGVNYYY